MKKILLPTDFSENAWNAIVYALALFKKEACIFYLLNSFQVGSSGLMTKRGRANDTRFFQLLKEESERKLEKTLQKLNKIDNNTDHEFRLVSLPNTLSHAIGRTVYDEGVDFIVMGTKGATGAKEVFLGSNTHKIIKRINFCPIIAVPEDYKFSGTIETILFATGYEHVIESYELKPMFDIVKLFDSKVMVLHAGDVKALKAHQVTARKNLKKHLKSIKHELREVPETKTVSGAIQKVVEEDGLISMVSMINYWHSFFEKMTQEPVIKKVAFNTQVPFLVLHLFE